MKRKGLVLGLTAFAGLVGLLAASSAKAEQPDEDLDDVDPDDGVDPDDDELPDQPPVDDPKHIGVVLPGLGDLPTDGPSRTPKHIGNVLPGLDDPTTDEPPTGDGPSRTPKYIGKDRPSPPDDGPALPELTVTYPRGARFYQVLLGDKFGGTSTKTSIAYRYLLAEAFLAAIEFGGLSEEEALKWAAVVAGNDRNRARVIDAIQCSGWNDAAYGALPKPGTRKSSNGRSILLLPLHAPIGDLLADGQQPVRNATMKGGLGNTSLRHLEFLWLPGLDRQLLWESGGTEISTSTGATVWADGTSQENPPPWVMALGMGDNSGELVDGRSFGCPGSEGELEV